MADMDRMLGNLQTFWVDLSDFSYEAVEEVEGRATLIRFKISGEIIMRGDILVVLDGAEVSFHGTITSVDRLGWAQAGDPRSRIAL